MLQIENPQDSTKKKRKKKELIIGKSKDTKINQ